MQRKLEKKSSSQVLHLSQRTRNFAFILEVRPRKIDGALQLSDGNSRFLFYLMKTIKPSLESDHVVSLVKSGLEVWSRIH